MSSARSVITVYNTALFASPRECPTLITHSTVLEIWKGTRKNAEWAIRLHCEADRIEQSAGEAKEHR